jgi:DNA-binding NarL/FixJ family response regulator
LNPVTNKSKSISVILADDHGIVREGLAALCDAQPELSVVGQCADGLEAVEMIQSLKPDFAVLDLHMPKMTGVQVVRKIRDLKLSTRVIILSVARDENTVIEALNAGADAYLLKEGPGRHLIDAINYIRDGGVYVTPLLRGAKLFTDAAQRGDNDDPLSSLSRREYEVFSYLVNGLRAKDIADLLAISPKTVDTYRASLMRKLNVHDLVGLVKFAIGRNLTTTSSVSS